MRRAILVAFLLSAGCSWAWDDFPVDQDAGDTLDGGRVDAGRIDGAVIDAGPDASTGPCAGDFMELCGAGTVCVRPSDDEVGCCEIGACLAHAGRPIAWARSMPDGYGSIDGMPGETHWMDAVSYPLTSVSASTIASEADASVSFSVAWTTNGFGIFISGTDDLNEGGMGIAPRSEIDVVELHIDLHPTNGDPGNANHIAVAVRSSASTVEHITHTGADAWTAFATTRFDGPGGTFAAEIFVFFADASTDAPLVGDAILLDVIYRDVDGRLPVIADDWQWARCDATIPAASGIVILGDSTPPATPACDQTCASRLCAPAGYHCERATPQLCN